MATIAMVTKIFSQGPIMAPLAFTRHVNGCRRFERGTLRYLLTWKPQKNVQHVGSCVFFLAFFGITFGYELLKNSGKSEIFVTMVVETLPWWPKCLLRLDGQMKRTTPNMHYHHYAWHGTVIPLYWLEPLERGKALVYYKHVSKWVFEPTCVLQIEVWFLPHCLFKVLKKVIRKKIQKLIKFNRVL